MKKSLILAALIAGGAPFGAATARAAAPAQQDSRQSWDDYRIKARKDLDVLEDRIAQLESDARTAEGDARLRLQSQSKALRDKKADADHMMNQLATATADARRELQMKLDRALRELKKSVRRAETRPRDRT